jgi:hypothetical protein
MARYIRYFRILGKKNENMADANYMRVTVIRKKSHGYYLETMPVTRSNGRESIAVFNSLKYPPELLVTCNRSNAHMEQIAIQAANEILADVLSQDQNFVIKLSEQDNSMPWKKEEYVIEDIRRAK